MPETIIESKEVPSNIELDQALHRIARLARDLGDGFFDEPVRFSVKPLQSNELTMYSGTGVQQVVAGMTNDFYIEVRRTRETDEKAFDPERIFTTYDITIEDSSKSGFRVNLRLDDYNEQPVTIADFKPTDAPWSAEVDKRDSIVGLQDVQTALGLAIESANIANV